MKEFLLKIHVNALSANGGGLLWSAHCADFFAPAQLAYMKTIIGIKQYKYIINQPKFIAKR